MKSPWWNSVNPLTLPQSPILYDATPKVAYLQSRRVKSRAKSVTLINTHLDVSWTDQDLLLNIEPTHGMVAKGLQTLNEPMPAPGDDRFERIYLILYNGSPTDIWITPGQIVCQVGQNEN